jgi:hypothetical protein
VIPTFIAAAFVFTTSAFAGRYEDLAAWTQRDKASSHQLLLDLAQARSAHDVALALGASADRQHKITSQLIEVVQRHPELRCMAELGLDEDALRRWSAQHPDADKRRSLLSSEVFRIATDMQDYTASLEKAPEAAARHTNIEKYRHAPEVAAAADRLGAVLADNEQRLMKAFDQ